MFKDRYDAGEQLARALGRYAGKKDVIILAIPRGALQMGEVLHKLLGAPLDIIVTKKIPHPANKEYAIGAVGQGGEYFLTEGAIGVEPEYISDQKEKLAAAVDAKYRRYRGDMPVPDLKGKTVILLDDGLATGSTMLAAIHVVRKQKPKWIVVAVPVSPPDTAKVVEGEADEFICLAKPPVFYAIGMFYGNFVQVEDEEAIAIFRRCR